MSDTNNEVRAPEEKRPSQGNAKRPSQGNAVPEGEPQASSVPRRSQGSTGGQARISIGGGEQRRASDVPNEDQRRASANPPADQLGAPAVPGDQPRGSITGDQPRLSLGADQPRLSTGAAGARGSVGQEGKRMSQTGQRLSQGAAMGELQQPRLSGAGQQRLSQGFSPGEDGLRRSQGATLEEQLQPETEGIVGASLGNPLNERTYQEVEYLKRSLGPILVAALAEICIRRPSDPIEYLGHWLLRWRYNEELKRRDVQNALEVVRKKTWADEQGLPDPNAPAIPPGPESFGAGFVPQHPYGPPGYGGPLGTDQVLNALAEDMPPVEEEEEMEETSEFLDVNEGLNMAPSVDRVPEIQPSLLAQASAAAIRTSLKKEGSAAVLAEGEKRASMGGEKRTSVGGEKRASMGGEKRASMGGEKRTSVGEKRASLKAEGSTVIQEKRASLGAEGGEKRTSIEGAPRKSLEEKRPSLKAEDKPPSGEEKRPSLSEKRPSLKSEAPGDAPTEVPPPAE